MSEADRPRTRLWPRATRPLLTLPARATPLAATDEWKKRNWDFLDEYPNGAFVVRAGSLGFSVVIFTICACCTIGLILLRRFIPSQPAELGGNKTGAKASAAFLIFLWFVYVLLSIMKAYEEEMGLAPFGF